MSLCMYCKEFSERQPDESWLGVIVNIDDNKKTGEVEAIKLATDCNELYKWFELYQLNR